MAFFFGMHPQAAVLGLCAATPVSPGDCSQGVECDGSRWHREGTRPRALLLQAGEAWAPLGE